MLSCQWLTELTLGFVSSLQKMSLLRIANQDIEEHIAAQRESAVLDNMPSKPFLMGSERINRALQNVLSYEGNLIERVIYIPAMDNTTEQKYSMGSESLDQALEEIMVPSMDTENRYVVEPAVEL